MSIEADRVRTQAFEVWLLNAKAQPEPLLPQAPEEQLLAEHHLMRAILAALEEEARQLLAGQPLRPDFWNHAVDFIGNFTHLVHRVKEEKIFFPALEKWGILDPEDCQKLEEDHVRLRDMTHLLCEGIAEGDWEKAFRLVAMYLGRMGPHLQAEEQRLLSPHLRSISEGRREPLLAAFAELEAERLGAAGRMHYVEVARTLCGAVGLGELLAAADDGNEGEA